MKTRFKFYFGFQSDKTLENVVYSPVFRQ